MDLPLRLCVSAVPIGNRLVETAQPYFNVAQSRFDKLSMTGYEQKTGYELR